MTLCINPAFADTIGRFTDIRGDVSLKRTKITTRPAINDPIIIKDLVITGEVARTKLMLIDSSLLTIGNNSRVEITDFLLDKDTRKGIILVKSGALHAKAESLAVPNSRFEIRTPTAVIGARGTEWFTETEEEGTSIYSMSQSINVYNPAYPNQIVTVPENHFSRVKKGSVPAPPQAYCPSDLHIIMKRWDLAGQYSSKKVNEGVCEVKR
ncbi:MAG: FecR family protein [Syntrophorhabdaceae bacterium]|nr:FecR family protein [Syntrophorhabdaceae bacterium]